MGASSLWPTSIKALALNDADGDGDRDLLVGNTGQNFLYLDDGAGYFVDVTAAQLPADSDSTHAVVLEDVDGDGDRDALLGNTGQDRLYFNNGGGFFSDVTGARLPVDSNATAAMELVDVDGDGDRDALIGNGGLSGREQNRLYLNDGTGTFTDVTSTQLPALLDYTSGLAVGDVDGDGSLDVLIGNYGSNSLYLNDGLGSFANVTSTRLPAIGLSTLDVALDDVDGDGDFDALIGTYDLVNSLATRNRLYQNDGLGFFTDVTTTHLPAIADATLALALVDVDGDGDSDAMIGNLSRNRLYLNDGAGHFTDVTAAQLPGPSSIIHVGKSRSFPPPRLHPFTQALALADVDGDGYPDAMIGGLAQNLLYLNDGAGSFIEVTATHLP